MANRFNREQQENEQIVIEFKAEAKYTLTDLLRQKIFGP
jgi:hypothetical protein